MKEENDVGFQSIHGSTAGRRAYERCKARSGTGLADPGGQSSQEVVAPRGATFLSVEARGALAISGRSQ